MKAPKPSLSTTALETRIGHTFASPELLHRALTHISHAPTDRKGSSYQRLEFLGDRVLGMAVSAMLFEAFPEAEEGELSRRLAGLVRKETCADVAAEWDVSPHIRLGDNEAQSGGHAKPAIMGDVCEAIIGALYLDGGYAVAEAAITAVWRARMLTPTRPLRDPKTALQEWAQGLGRPAPVYREVKRQGPAHAPNFTVSVELEGFVAATGVGTSKRAAEQTAAQDFLTREGILTAGNQD
ncbi:ribonuclease III [Lichenihabitans psoromatis]|uniref:ribonuclease III n=1 Tax=Lichenihabitans psoromatis TaxID=2528642 RepID=UPI001038578D|nr:ribonuclease III [Lichenihabitans psoromatis]